MAPSHICKCTVSTHCNVVETDTIVVHEAFWIHLVVFRALSIRLDHLLETGECQTYPPCTSTNKLEAESENDSDQEERLTKLSNFQLTMIRML